MVSKAITVRIIAKILGSITIVATTSTAMAKPTMRMTEGKPSRNITRKNEKYTNANPVSLCKTVSAAGNKAMAAAMNCDRGFEKSVSGRDKYLASANATQILQNSAG